MRIIKHKQFDKSMKLLLPKIQHKAIASLEVFVSNPFDDNLRNHALKGKRHGFRSIDVTGDYRIIFRELSD
jgi:mRNA-degrading endonuclease YafQ of YafQ-DinJ toxin-antitoxin module